jgi:hypothetical protein
MDRLRNEASLLGPGIYTGLFPFDKHNQPLPHRGWRMEAMMKFIDLTGQKFGRLFVLHYCGKNKHRESMFQCQCNCQNKTIVKVRGHALRAGITQSCGCFQKEQASKATSKDLTGKTFGKWQVLERIPQLGCSTKYKCRCACGNIRLVTGSTLGNGQSKGCRNCGHSMEYGYAAKNKYYIEYKHDASRRDYEFDLSFEAFVEICENKCTYCGSDPSYLRRPGKAKTGNWYCNGIDRIDNKIGYVKSNCTAACTTCNLMKSKMSPNKFIEHVKLICSYQESAVKGGE